MAPFPSNYYARPDASMPTGWRIDFPPNAITSDTGTKLDPTPYESNDGFSPGSPILALVPDLSAATSGLPGPGDVQACTSADSPIVLLDSATLGRLSCWAELDAKNPNPANAMLIIHPAANLPEGHRIIVALRNMATAGGQEIAPRGLFATILAGDSGPATSSAKPIERHISALLADLAKIGIPHQGLYLAWDFTVASEQNLTSWTVSMRDQAFHQLGKGVPRYSVTAVTNFTPAQNSSIARQVTGTFDVPSFLNKPGGPQGSFLHFGSGGLPSQMPGNIQHAVFSCLIPRSTNLGLGTTAVAGVHPARPILYGKGLLSVATQMDAPGVIATANQYDLVLCSTNWLGLDGNDISFDLGVVSNLSDFPSIPDRLQQSMIDALFLARLMTDPQGLPANSNFRLEGRSLIDTATPIEYYGNSEGSLMGAAVTAISTQWKRAVLGVPSMNYAVLLPRSEDFAPFARILSMHYTGPSVALILFDIMSMLWDRAEADGYVENLDYNPLPGTPVHQVLLQMAFGDHQVANVSTFAEARTLAAAVHRPTLPPAQSATLGGDPFAGLPSTPNTGSYSGPATLYEWYDTAVAAPPAGDLVPTTGPDPHDSVPRAVAAAQQQLVTFLDTGSVPDTCGTQPCVTTQPL